MKKELQTGLLLTANLGMELSWLLAYAVMIMPPITHRLFSVPEAILVFVLAVGITRFVNRRVWRRLPVLAIQGVGCLCACLLLIHAFHRDGSLFSSAWIYTIFDPRKTALDWLVLALTVFWATVFWFGGMTLAQRSSRYLAVCKRFDIGSGMLLGLLLTRIVIYHDTTLVNRSMILWLIALFFISGLMAIGLARQDRPSFRSFITGYRIQGVLISVVIMTLVLSVIFLTFLWPSLNAVAETGYAVFKTGMRIMGPVLVAILSADTQNNRAQSGGGITGKAIMSGNPDTWGGHVMEIFLWSFGVIAAVIAMVGLGIGLWRLFKWLFAKTSDRHDRPRPSGGLRDWLLRLTVFLSFCWEWIAHYIRNYNTIFRIYRALVNWGKHSGVPCKETETPLEFSRRLGRLLPVVQSEISVISNLFQQEVYAEQSLDPQQFNQARLALRRLRSPDLWIPRIRIWFVER